MTSPDYQSHFSLANIPFGVASSNSHPSPQCVTRLENNVIFLADLQRSGVFAQVASLPEGIFEQSSLNEYAALPKSTQREVRAVLQEALAKPLPTGFTEDISAVTLHMPVAVGGFTDFSCSLHHVRNAGRAILNDESPPPGFFNFPIGYNGRASTIFVSGTPVIRPQGHFFDRSAPTEKKPIVYGPSQALDYELEIGVIVGKGVPRLQGLNAKDADEHIFGFVILNDWSARDIQGCEMIPLGPLNGKSFGTSISPWIVTLDALEPFKVPGPKPETVLASHLEDIAESSYAIDLKVEIITGSQTTTVTESKAQDLHWSGRQMAAHLASTGADIQTGDIIGTGTVSGPIDGSYGCLLEITKAGKEPITLVDGSKRHFLLDGDVVRMTAVVGGSESGIGFGECIGEIQPAMKL
ncbi:Fumarylacetoacetase [Penicillium rolfsii]|nr:Fumarylacetoacetase [Penicillium rolfsii]